MIMVEAKAKESPVQKFIHVTITGKCDGLNGE
jgi:hypothetical protein